VSFFVAEGIELERRLLGARGTRASASGGRKSEREEWQQLGLWQPSLRGQTEAVVATVQARLALREDLSFSARKRQVSTETCRFQLNPPLRVGEILLRNVKYACGV